MPGLTLISHDLCPYVQRAVIALTEKGVAFDRVYVDLADKPDWFRAISPLGKVPLLVVGDARADEPGSGRVSSARSRASSDALCARTTESPRWPLASLASAAVIFESAVILEYLEETQPSPLYPADPLARARHRAMIEFGSAILSDIWGLEIAPSREAAVPRIAALTEKFARLERELDRGPWFAGETFGLVDAVFGPVFRYFDLLDRLLEHGIFAGTPKVAAWRAALEKRPSVRRAVVADYPQRLERFVASQNGYLAALLPKRAA